MLDKPLELSTRRQQLRFLGEYLVWGVVFSVSVFVVTTLRVNVHAPPPEEWTVATVLPLYLLSGLTGGFLCAAMRLSKSGIIVDTFAFALSVLPTLVLSAWLDVLIPVASVRGFWAATLLAAVFGLGIGVGFRVVNRLMTRFASPQPHG